MPKTHSGRMAGFFTATLAQTANIVSLRWVSEAIRRRKAKRDFQRLIQGYDDAIAAARAKHRSTRALEQAKTDYVHSLLRRAA